MGSLWLRIRVWTKVVLFVLLFVYALFFIAKNTQPVQLWVWFFAAPLTTPLLVVALCAFLVGVVGTLLMRTTLKTVRQIREMRERTRSEKMERQVADMQTKAAMLRARGAGSVADAAPDQI